MQETKIKLENKIQVTSKQRVTDHGEVLGVHNEPDTLNNVSTKTNF